MQIQPLNTAGPIALQQGAALLAGVDLYRDIFGQIRSIPNLKGHPYEFYPKTGLRHRRRDP